MKQSILSRFLILGFVTAFCSPWVGGAVSAQHSSSETIARIHPTEIDTPSWPTQGTITQGFSSTHLGIDIAGSLGTPIRAAKAGEVVFSGWDTFGLGNAIKLKHADGTYTIYGHGSRLWVREGQKVAKGQTIALMGSTGNSTGPHLHFEVRQGGVRGRWVDPFAVLPPLVRGKIPSPRTVAAAPESETISANTIRFQEFPVVQTPTACDAQPLIAGETSRFRVNVCQVGDRVFYFGQSKTNPADFVWLQARHLVRDRYRADNGSFSYYVNSRGVVVFQNGRPIRSEGFLR
ncbi:M23 family metallopeptidase [Lusitaniella coriacea]|uniref:M23 family metallopeptidase n=1 Tax=Lusitaniella coriacea TaxID=1983105 RepID=UPI003CF52791